MPPKLNNKISQADNTVIESSKLKVEFKSMQKIQKQLRATDVLMKLPVGVEAKAFQLTKTLELRYKQMSLKEKIIYNKLIRIIKKLLSDRYLTNLALAYKLAHKKGGKEKGVLTMGNTKEVFYVDTDEFKWTTKNTVAVLGACRKASEFSKLFSRVKGKEFVAPIKIKYVINQVIWKLNQDAWKAILKASKTRNYTDAITIFEAIENAKILKPPVCSNIHWKTLMKTKAVIKRYAAKAPKVTNRIERSAKNVNFPRD